MSWSINIAAVPVDGFEAACDAAPNNSEVSVEGQAQIDAAKAAAKAIVASGAVGSGWVAAYMNGHANPNHEPRAGWVNDETGLRVYQVPAPVIEGQAEDAGA